MITNNLLDSKLFVKFFLLINITVFLSIIVHELGHYVSANALGYTPELHYNKISFENDSSFYKKIQNNPSAEVKNKIQNDKILWNVMGPIVTIVIGSLGFLLLF